MTYKKEKRKENFVATNRNLLPNEQCFKAHALILCFPWIPLQVSNMPTKSG